MNTENKKYTSIMVAGKDLFWKYGFRRVTVDEICRKADVSKMTFYKFFPDKIELAKKIFDNIVEEGHVRLKEIMNDDSSPTEKIRKMIIMKLESTDNISREFLQDFYVDKGELKNYVEEKTMLVWKSVIKDFKSAQTRGVFRNDFNPELIIKMQSKISELLEDESVTSLYKSQQDLIIELAKFMFYGIAPHD